MNISLIFRMLLVCTLHSCTATIMVKFGSVAGHYDKNMEKANSLADPLENCGLYSRQLLCDAVVNAKQFTIHYATSHDAKPRNSIFCGDSHSDVTLNYQRLEPNSSDSNYQLRYIRGGRGSVQKRGVVRCVNTPTVKWFVTFGLSEKFMYLLEDGQTKRKRPLRIAGILEPSAVIQNRPAEYLYTQLRVKIAREMMESICDLGAADVLRLCSAVVDVLSVEADAKFDSTRTGYIFERHRNPCVVQAVKDGDHFVWVKVLRCSIFDEETPFKPFYVLPDGCERAAVFVFFVEIGEGIQLHARVTKIGALLNPAGPKEVKLLAEQAGPVEEEHSENILARLEDTTRIKDEEEAADALKKLSRSSGSQRGKKPMDLENTVGISVKYGGHDPRRRKKLKIGTVSDIYGKQ